MFFTKRKAIILIIICSIFFILTYNDVRSKEFQIISGTALVTDGDTIKINKKTTVSHHGFDGWKDHPYQSANYPSPWTEYPLTCHRFHRHL